MLGWPKLHLERFLPAGACLSPSNLIRIRLQGTQSPISAFSAAPQENHLEEPERHILYQFFFLAKYSNNLLYKRRSEIIIRQDDCCKLKQ